MFGMVGRALVGAAASLSALALTILIEVLPARAEMPLAAKCNTANNITLDERIAGCTAIIQAAQAMQQSVIMAYFRRAMFYRQKGETELAIADYNLIIERDPGNLNARLQRAFAHVERRQTDAALADYEKVIELDPKAVYARLGRARIYWAKGDMDRAIADYDQALLVHPDNVIVHVDRGLAYIRKGDTGRAMTDCNRAVEIGPQAGIGQLCRSRAYAAQGNRERALAELDQTMQIKPRNEYFYYFRAESFSLLGEFDRAIADFNRVIQLAHQGQGNPGDRQAQPQGQDADPISASVAGESIVLASADGPVLRARGAAYNAKGDLDRAIADYDEAIRLNPKDKDAFGLRANAHKAKGDFDRSLADYDQLVQLDAKDARAYFHRARVYWQIASFAKSLADLDQAIQLDPKNAYPILWREIVAKRSDQPSQLGEAAKQLDAAKWPAPVVNLFLGTMTPEQVRSAADDADPAKKKGQVCEANFYTAERALQSGSRDEALKLFEQAAADCPKTFLEKPAADVELGALRASR
ncbi:tetratricopeptide repeat protein [Bradyrhizobium liaoningense]|uniref:tetratricopeptide repeat protein n=1 Tax=Bradyrhizobium liaoningense TaxID=43992 RepID=UPI001BA81AD7|nr:tetratricopeptide repeat protein [Bradyrhizobium liaoningense]MBR0709568.1 tetratricopeptide repeat protein [Bradyrhizobium liaoningense]